MGSLILCLARGGRGLIHFFALPPREVGDLYILAFAFLHGGVGLVQFSPLPCPSKDTLITRLERSQNMRSRK